MNKVYNHAFETKKLRTWLKVFCCTNNKNKLYFIHINTFMINNQHFITNNITTA